MVTIGTFILSFGIYNFYYQNGITEGGVLGILLILKNMFGVEVSISNIKYINRWNTDINRF